MTKEEILKNHQLENLCHLTSNEFHTCLNAMDQYAESISISFCWWILNNTIRINGVFYISHFTEDQKFFGSIGDIYNYWCEKIMNTQQKEIE